MENFRLINNRSYYSRAYKLYRQTILDKIGLLLVAGAVVLIVLLVKFFAFAKAYNGRLKPSGAPRGFREEIVYGFHVIFHPFDGFWDLKHERRGGMRAPPSGWALPCWSSCTVCWARAISWAKRETCWRRW